MTEVRRCAVCDGPMRRDAAEWVWRCLGCGFLASDLWDEGRWQRKESALNETHRIEAIKALRKINARATLELLAKLRTLEKAELCDVGCGYGWFLETARDYGVSGTGIEPEERIAAEA